MKGRRRLRRVLWLLGPLLTLLVFGGPTLLLHLVVTKAEACFASIPGRAEAALPVCEENAHLIAPLEQLPFIGRPAKRAHEEIIARAAVWAYVDSAIGEPDRAERGARFAPLAPAAYTIWEGSMRLRMDEVGPPMPVPEPGALAFSTGDRDTLDQRAFSWTQHYTETRAIEAVLLDGRFDRAVRLAEHYQGRPNTDLRVKVGALLCAGGQIDTGIAQVISVERGRAESRTANFARNYGGARAVHVACAHRGGLEPAPPPLHGDAGSLDHRARLAVMDLRRARTDHPACDLSDPLACRALPDVANALETAREILRAERPTPHRLALLATVAESLTSGDVAARYGVPRVGEPALAAATPLYPDKWLEHVPDAPFVTAARYEAAAQHLADLSTSAKLRPIVSALFVRAAVAHAQSGDLQSADRTILRAGLDASTHVITRANAALVAGDRAEAARRAGVEAPRHPRLLLLRAALALPDVDMARARATEALAQAHDSHLAERVRWLLVTLGVPTRGNEVVAAKTFEAPPRYRYTGWRDALTSDEVRAANVDDALAVWHSWLSSDNRRESRYAAFFHRGDAPEGLTPLLFAGVQLTPSQFSSDQTEMWLDALMAFDARRFSMRQVAFARWRAAAWRGDDAAGVMWRERFMKLAAASQDPKRADLWSAVRL